MSKNRFLANRLGIVLRTVAILIVLLVTTYGWANVAIELAILSGKEALSARANLSSSDVVKASRLPPRRSSAANVSMNNRTGGTANFKKLGTNPKSLSSNLDSNIVQDCPKCFAATIRGGRFAHLSFMHHPDLIVKATKNPDFIRHAVFGWHELGKPTSSDEIALILTLKEVSKFPTRKVGTINVSVQYVKEMDTGGAYRGTNVSSNMSWKNISWGSVHGNAMSIGNSPKTHHRSEQLYPMLKPWRRKDSLCVDLSRTLLAQSVQCLMYNETRIPGSCRSIFTIGLVAQDDLTLSFETFSSAELKSRPVFASTKCSALAHTSARARRTFDGPAFHRAGLVSTQAYYLEIVNKTKVFEADERSREAQQLADIQRQKRRVYPSEAHVPTDRHCTDLLSHPASASGQGQLTIVVVAAIRDMARLRILLSSLDAMAETRSLATILIVAPLVDVSAFESFVVSLSIELAGAIRVVPETHIVDSKYPQKKTLYMKGGRVLDRSGWILQQALKLFVAKHVETEFYLVMDADVFAVRPFGFNSLVVNGRGVLNIAPNIRLAGQFGEWWRWAVDIIGESINTVNPGLQRLGVTPVLLSAEAVLKMLDHISVKHKMNALDLLMGPDAPPWTEFTLYYTFLATQGLLNRYHLVCEGVVVSHCLWSWMSSDDFDIQLMLHQSYSIFTIIQSIGKARVDADSLVTMLYDSATAARTSPSESAKLLFEAQHQVMQSALQRGTAGVMDSTVGPEFKNVDTQVYMTFLCGPSYVAGAIVLGRSLRASGTERGMYVMVAQHVLSSAMIALLETVYTEVIEVPTIENPTMDRKFREMTFPEMMREFPTWQNNAYQGCLYTKLRVFQQYRFSKVVYVDADMLVVRNLDDLFERNHFSAAPDVMPPDKFNTGLFVFSPNLEMWHLVQQNIHKLPSYNGGDQGFMNALFPNWFTSDETFRLPSYYNTQTKVLEASKTSWMVHGNQLRTYHYSPGKPWHDPLCTGGNPAVSHLHCEWWHHLLSLFETQQLNRSMRETTASLFTNVDVSSLVHATFTLCASVPPDVSAYSMKVVRTIGGKRSTTMERVVQHPVTDDLGKPLMTMLTRNLNGHSELRTDDSMRVVESASLQISFNTRPPMSSFGSVQVSGKVDLGGIAIPLGVSTLRACVEPARVDDIPGFYLHSHSLDHVSGRPFGASTELLRCFGACVDVK